MENLKKLLDVLENRAYERRIPACWVSADEKGYIKADLCELARRRVQACLSRETNPGFPEDKRDFVIYSMLIRSAAGFLREDNTVCGGTFLKALLLLPGLQRMGVNTIYLLPVFECSPLYKKGGLPSPYAVSDYRKLDPSLHDDALGEYSEELLLTQFKAFIEACHALGMRVVLDFVFRTLGRQNALIAEHPDWFYWIRTNKEFTTPKISAIRGQQGISERNVKTVYASVPNEYFEKFSPDPKALNPGLWDEIKHSGDILSAAEKAFSLTTAPAFSDWINDAQPPWTDVTYLRYELAANAHRQTGAPFVLFDAIKHNVFPPNAPNRALYDYIAGIIPFYQDMGIDGARIDMAHALPMELLDEIRDTVKAKNPDFLLWSEEFNANNAAHLKASGFEMISGNTWYHLPRVQHRKNWKEMLRDLLASALPVTAALELPDTPRIALRYAGKRLEALHMLAALLPNCAMFINAGQEMGEPQPMNLGLDNTEQGRFVLSPEDPMYGRLAFFDEFAPRHANAVWLTDCIVKALECKKNHLELIRNGRCVFGVKGKLMYLGYILGEKRVCFVLNTGKRAERFKKKLFSGRSVTVDSGAYRIISNI